MRDLVTVAVNAVAVLRLRGDNFVKCVLLAAFNVTVESGDLEPALVVVGHVVVWIEAEDSEVRVALDDLIVPGIVELRSSGIV